MTNIGEIEIVKRIIELHNKHKDKKKYNLNVIEEFRANENAHTRILLKLFMYKNDKGENTFLNKFIEIINKELLSRSIQYINISEESNVCIEEQYHYIDGYIKSSKNEWAIIIENKINFAKDMPKQIERYMETALKEVEKEKIVVVYLTLDGSKKIDDISKTKKVEKLLDFSEDDIGRFLELNYKNHILPSLLDENSVPKKEEILKSAIVQYKNHIMEKLHMNKENDEYNNAINADLLTDLGFDEDMTPRAKLNKIDEIADLIEDRLESLKLNVFPDAWRAENIRHSLNLDFKVKYGPHSVKERKKYNAVFLWVNKYKDRDNRDLCVGIVFDSDEDIYFTCAICEKGKWNQLPEGKTKLGKTNLKSKYSLEWVGGRGKNYYETGYREIPNRYTDKAKDEIKRQFEEFIEDIL